MTTDTPHDDAHDKGEGASDPMLQGLDPARLLALAEEARRSSPDDAASRDHVTPRPKIEPWPIERVDAIFEDLDVVAILGAGGMGAVYRARQTKLNRDVALKLVHPDLAGEPDLAERFTREAHALASLSHPNIVTVHDVGVTDGVPWLVMEYIEGTTLRDAMRSGDLDGAAALALVGPMCEALQFAHDAGVVHRDIKPENVLLGTGGVVKVADFGLAKIVGSEDDSLLTMPNQVMGTLRYMAPEQFDSPSDVDHRADIYSLGVVFYEMLTGHVPQGRFEPPSVQAAVDARIDDIVLRALERQPLLRYQQAADVKTDVDALKSDTAQREAPPGRDVEGRPWTTADQREEWRDVGRLVIATGAALIGIWIVQALWATPVVGVLGVAVGIGFGAFCVWMLRRHEPRLRDAWGNLTKASRVGRTVAALVFATAAWIFTVLGVVAAWEMYCPRYAPPVSSIEQAKQMSAGFALDQRLKDVLPEEKRRAVGHVAVTQSSTAQDLFGGSPGIWLLLALVTGCVAGARMLDLPNVDLRRSRSLLLACMPILGVALAVTALLVYAMAAQAIDGPWPLQGVAGARVVEVPIAEIRGAFDEEFGIGSDHPSGYMVHVQQRGSVRSALDYEDLAQVDVYLVDPDSVAERWDASNIFIRRKTPRLLVHLTGDPEGRRTHVQWNAGAFPSHAGTAARLQKHWEEKISDIVGE